jgi:hypothetical protein
MFIRVATSAVSLAVTVAALFAAAPPAFAQAPTCTGAIRNASVAIAREPGQKRIMREVRRKAPAEWSAAVVKQCPRLDPSWPRAKKRTSECGFFSSSMRYTCVLVGTPALKKRR